MLADKLRNETTTCKSLTPTPSKHLVVVSRLVRFWSAGVCLDSTARISIIPDVLCKMPKNQHNSIRTMASLRRRSGKGRGTTSSGSHPTAEQRENVFGTCSELESEFEFSVKGKMWTGGSPSPVKAAGWGLLACIKAKSKNAT